MKSITFTIGEENKPKIEKYKDLKDSIFKEQYNKVLESIAEHIENVKRENGNSITFEKFNNIFAFIGDRGSGKTSCMMSIAEMLEFGEYKENNIIIHDQEKPKQNTSFYVLDLIDPSFFDSEFNIIELIIGKMFSTFKKSLDKNNTKAFECESETIYKKSELIKKFQEVQKDLKASQKKTFEDGDNIESLLNLASNVNLKESIKGLIDSFLDYFKNNNYLVIPIDDIDINTKHADIMVEEIRRYFVLPNVIILMAAKLSQLSHVLNLKHFREYEKLLDKAISSDDIKEMSERYLEKLIPTEHRIYLPEVENLYLASLKIINNDGSEDNEYITVKEAVTSLIFTKTRYLFYHTKGVTNFIVPSNLRELRHLIFLLYKMEDNNELKRGNVDGALYNKTIFKKYFFETWTENNLDSNGKKIASELISIADAGVFNKMAISLIYHNYKSYIDSNDELKNIVDKSNNFYNISLGDVLAIVDYLDDKVLYFSDRKLLFFIRSLYSIKLYEYYDEITEDHEIHEKYEKESILLNDERFVGLSNYDKIIGGNYINSNIKQLLPGGYDSILKIRFDIIKGLINKINDKKNNDDIAKLIDHLDNTVALNIVEFFALIISRKFDSKALNSNLYYRQSKEIYYNSDLSNLTKNITIDISSIFYNITRIEETYNRINPELFNIAKENNNSLYNKVKSKVIEREKYAGEDDSYIKNRFLSWSIIRNVEILNSLISEIEHDKLKNAGSGTGYPQKLRNFFSKVSSFTTKSYDKEDGSPYIINFGFYSVIKDFFPENKNLSYEIDSLFDLILTNNLFFTIDDFRNIIIDEAIKYDDLKQIVVDRSKSLDNNIRHEIDNYLNTLTTRKPVSCKHIEKNVLSKINNIING